MPVVGLPWMRTSPSLSASWPSTQLHSVDLPEPFGPMMPRISPSRTSNETPSTAVMPPNDLRRLETWRTGVMAAAIPPARQRRPGRALVKAEQAGRADGHHEHDRRGIDDKVVALRHAQPFRQQHRHKSAEERSVEVAAAADDHHEQQIK